MLRNTQTLPPPRNGEGIEQALELCAMGIEMMRERLQRERPGITDDEIGAEIRAWLLRHPGPEHTDARLVRRRPR